MQRLDYRDCIAHGDFVYRQDHTPIICRAESARLFDADDQPYIDLEAANGAAIFGYDVSLFDSAVAAARSLPGVPSFMETEIRLKVAKRLCQRIDSIVGESGRVSFEVGGASGIELAIRIARLNGFTGPIFVLGGGYHGRSLLTSHLSSSQRYRDVWQNAPLNVIRLPYFSGSKEPNARLSQIAEILTSEFNGVSHSSNQTVKGILIVECVQNVSGINFLSDAYFSGLVDMFRAAGCAVVCDEIFTGMHRMGSFLAVENYRARPDFVVLSKGLTNGFVPSSVVWGRENMMSSQSFPPGSYSATYINAPLAMHLIDKVLDRMDDPSFPDMLQELSLRIQQNLDALYADHDQLVHDISVRGACARIVFKKDIATELRSHLRKAVAVPNRTATGVLVASTGMARNVIALHPPFNICLTDLDEGMEILSKGVGACKTA